MKALFFLLPGIIFFVSCKQQPASAPAPVKKDTAALSQVAASSVLQDTIHSVPETKQLSKADGGQRALVRQALWKKFSSEYTLTDSDTLFDINYDGNNDYLIRYEGLSGTGFKHRAAVYVYDPQKGTYVEDQLLSSVPNPTYYIPQQKITGFYIGLGAGDGVQLEWQKGKWTLTKAFSVESGKPGSLATWTVNYPLTGRQQHIKLPFQMVPPEEVLETKGDW